jgi:hypothetical protein
MPTNHPDISRNLHTPMLSIASKAQYQRPVTEGLWTILSSARTISTQKKAELIHNGRKLTLAIDGRPLGNRPVTFVIYHVPFDSNENKTIGSFDVPPIDHSKIKHLELVRWTIKAIRRNVPQAEVVLCTDRSFGAKLLDLNPTLLFPEVERNRPMYYRVKTYNTIIQNQWTSGVTFFIDSDAIVLKDPSHLPSLMNFKIGVTYRYAPNLMPINEGVIIARNDTEECSNFFAHYMGTYEEIRQNKIIQTICKNDLMRWRGGQLSLNAVCASSKMCDFRDSNEDIRYLPCSTYNRTVRSTKEVSTLDTQDTVYIAHIKGKAKQTQNG